MVRLSPEAKVGIFVFIGIAILVFMSLKVGGMKFAREQGYELTVRLENAVGLSEEASVRIAGVKVGTIKSITLDRHKAKLILAIKPDIKVGNDFTALLKSSGLLGDKYLELMPGEEGAPLLEDGDEITRVASYSDMDKLIGALTDVAVDAQLVTASLAKVLGGEEGQASLQNIVDNLEDITRNVNAIVRQNNDRFYSIMANLDDFSESIKVVSDDLNEVIGNNKADINTGISNLASASEKLNTAMATLNQIAPDIQNITRKIDEGEGTIGKLINEPTTHDKFNKTLTGVNNFLDQANRFKTYIGYRGEYLFDQAETKSYISLKIQPKTDKYYLLEVIDDPRGFKRTDKKDITVNGKTRRTESTTISDDIKFSLQLAKRFDQLTLRAGMIETTAGVGFDYNMLNDKLEFKFDAFDFDTDVPPHLKAGLMFHLNKYLYLNAGYDDFINDEGFDSAYFGLGLEFEDEDLKFLFTSTPSVSF